MPNAVLIPQGKTPLHSACAAINVTNLNFVELLLKEGADPNVQYCLGKTPLMRAIVYASGAAKFLLNWPTTDVNITIRSGASFLTSVRSTFTDLTSRIAPLDVHHQFLLQ
jgi:ankyrin repeat protein